MMSTPTSPTHHSSPPPYIHDWGVPSVKLPPPASRRPITSSLTSWGQLQFTPLGAPLQPERLKAHCYIPPRFLAEHPDAHLAIAAIIQTFLEQVRLPTVDDWKRRALLIWMMGSTATDFSPYIFPGRPAGSLAHSAAPHDIEDITRDEDAHMEALDRLDVLQLDNDSLHSANRALRTLLETTTTDFEYQRHVLEADGLALGRQVTQLESDLRVSRISFWTSTPPPSQRAPPTSPPHGAPPAYAPTTPSRLASQAPSGSPWREPASLRDQSGLGAATHEFLQTHGLMHLTDALSLLVHVVRPALWSTELARFSALPATLHIPLLEVLDRETV
ncbi:hypothetical protein C8R43DRAFT_1123007 [Mycena crocata]|nr:hypothetical protein C8R43DRAFT_1123007 [Mycena crocata]